jgi:hypothetical protein
MNENMFVNMIVSFTNKIKKLIGISKLGFSSKTSPFCETFISYMFIHFKNIYDNPYIEKTTKDNIKQLYNYINE